MPNDLEMFLKRTVLDQAFRELARTDPEVAFQGFELTAEEQDILRHGDERMLNLLGRVLQADWQLSPESAAHTESSPVSTVPEPDAPSLPLVDLTLRLTPFVSETEDGDPAYRFAASLHPWPMPDAAQADANVAVDFHIHIVPTIIRPSGASAQVSYAATIDGRMRDDLTPETPADASSSVVPRYFGHSLAAEQASKAVLEATPSERRAKLHALAHALRTGDQVD